MDILETDQLARSLDILVTREAEEGVRKTLGEHDLLNSVDAIPVLTKRFATVWVAYLLESCYWQIWGSQIKILENLNARSSGESLEVIKSLFYDLSSQMYASAFENYPFENYIAFLQIRTFVILEGINIKITFLGRAFLSYIVSSGKSLDKAY